MLSKFYEWKPMKMYNPLFTFEDLGYSDILIILAWK